MNSLKNLLVFASGDKVGGGSGAKKLVEASQSNRLAANIVGFVSNHPQGGVWSKAQELSIPFFHFPAPWTAERYQEFVSKTNADFIALSGWLKKVTGLPADRTINIHPGPLPRFGGPGMYGHHVHEAVIKEFRRGGVSYSEICMHFVTEKYDDGPVFFRQRVEILTDDTPETLFARVNGVEHANQWLMTHKVVTGQIRWDGKNPASLVGGIFR